MMRPPPRSTLLPYTTLFRSAVHDLQQRRPVAGRLAAAAVYHQVLRALGHLGVQVVHQHPERCLLQPAFAAKVLAADRKSTRLNSSHATISYAVFCLKKHITS